MSGRAAPNGDGVRSGDSGARYDVLIRGGRVLDGSGNPWFVADVGVRGDRIVAVGRLCERGSPGGAVGGGADGLDAAVVVDAAGMVVAPGFIDTHVHSDLMILADPALAPKVRQGITTELLGQDGLSVAPVRAEHVAQWRSYVAALQGDPDVPWTWRTFDDYLRAIEAARPGVNAAALVGHGAIRQWVMGLENRQPSAAELAQMERLVAEAMAAGAFGMSIGLIYLPCVFARRDELVALYRIVGASGGVMVIHMRNEADYWLEAIEETLGIAEEARCGLLISHFKAVGRHNWDKMPTALRMLEQARERGVDVSFDQYPYTAGSTLLSAILPPWAVEGGTGPMLQRLARPADRARIRREFETGLPPEAGGWDNIARAAGWDGILITSVKSERNRWAEGQSLVEIAKALGRDPADAAFDLLLEEEGAVGMIDFIGSEEVIAQAMAHPLQMVGSDGLLLGRPHPRAYGTFPRVLGDYCRERGLFSLAEAVRKMTSAPAQRLGLFDRGLVRPGMVADLVVFDPATVIDTATYMEPRQYPRGISHVIVGGRHVVRDGEHTGERAGRVLRHVGAVVA